MPNCHGLTQAPGVSVVTVAIAWRDHAVSVSVCNTAGSALVRDINAYKITNNHVLGFVDLGDGTSDEELTLDTDEAYMDGTQYHALMIVLQGGRPRLADQVDDEADGCLRAVCV